MKKAEGSVTVFLTFIFLLLFSLAGAGLDSARFWGSRGYIETAAWSAQMAPFGNYNKELYQEYKLFSYGGYDGLEEKEWLQEYKEILGENLRSQPEKKQGWQGLFSKNYVSVYQIQDIEISLLQASYLAQEQEFLRQIDAWMQTAAFTELTSLLLGQVTGNKSQEPETILEELQEKKKVEIENSSEEGEASETDSKSSAEEKETQKQNKNPSNENPLTFFRELVSHGILRLVCEEETLSEKEIETREEEKGSSKDLQKPDWCQEEDEIELLEGVLEQSDSLWNDEMTLDSERKGKLLLYSFQMFQNYLEKGEKHADYGLEYLVAGKKKEKDNMAYIINRLFFLRSIIDYAYVNQNPLFVKKSMATASEIAVLFGGEPFIPLIQQGILIVLAMEEACVDVTALLQGRVVPFVKTESSFQMKYEEICLGSEALFQSKAKAFPKADKAQQLKGIKNGFGYVHYLWLLMLMTPWEQLYSRTLDLIQDDLRERFNESFEIEKCICGTKVAVNYQLSMLSLSGIELSKKDISEKQRKRQGTLSQKITMQYKYQ